MGDLPMTNFRPNRQARAQLARQPEHKKMLREQAERVKDSAERETPIGETGDTIDRYAIVEFPTRMRVLNHDPFFHLTEFGSVNNAAYAPLRRGVRRAGLRLDEDDKPGA